MDTVDTAAAVVLRGGLLLAVRRHGASEFGVPLARDLASETGLLLRSWRPMHGLGACLAVADGVAAPTGAVAEVAWIDDACEQDGIALGEQLGALVPELRARGLLRRRAELTGRQSGQRVVLAVDLDGTTVFDGDRPGPRVTAVLTELVEREDVRVVVATSRAPRGVRTLLGPLAERVDLLCCNGSLHAHEDRLTRFAQLPPQRLHRVVGELTAEGTPFYLEYGDRFAVSGAGFAWMDYPDRCALPAEPELAGVVKLVVDAPEPPWGAARLRELAGPGTELCPHTDGVIEVTPVGVSKATGLAALLGGPADPLVVFGNDLNDQDLLGHADMAVVVGDGLPGVERAGHVRRVAAQDGAVAMALRQAVG
ncbi:hypothetical protein GCM10010174_40090 [Kutzneria viridogrisea]|uniref:Sucrose phosphatase-like domain-containing protein n=2 Tax=Kutzneria TaxID=43356 RepID=W5W710_9PSEU|nr:HAD hydrolase family protein [Kutzneria albida]AHH96657.1 hypothetical protein KALB_3290 [Kutzneria albida DSM 43870]MBA8928122.1 hypothetical protein [Kutzneria viridogrisea]